MNDVNFYLKQFQLPKPDSHKGQNGKLLIIGGSELFHAASKWSLDVASKCVDMVFYASVPSNNELVKQAKSEFWNGIVIERDDLEAYIKEADTVLIGPGMTRTSDTEETVNHLLKTYPEKRWVIDAGALQMVDPKLLNRNCILTPHYQELMMLSLNANKAGIEKDYYFTDFMPQVTELHDKHLEINLDCGRGISRALGEAAFIIKGHLDIVAFATEAVAIEGGNPGMTKGGTGDVLAGLVAALYCTQSREVAAVVGSYVNKKAGEALAKNVGPFFNASDLVNQIPVTLWQVVGRQT